MKNNFINSITPWWMRFLAVAIVSWILILMGSFFSGYLWFAFSNYGIALTGIMGILGIFFFEQICDFLSGIFDEFGTD